MKSMALHSVFAYGRGAGIDGSATDVREDLLHVLQFPSP
jgi:hypothetical protein